MGFSFLSYSQLQEEYYLKALRLLAVDARMTQRDLAEALGVSLGKANYCVKALLDKGFIKAQNFRNSNNKLAYTYLLTPAGIAAKTDLTLRFLKFKMGEFDRIQEEIRLLTEEVAGDALRKEGSV